MQGTLGVRGGTAWDQPGPAGTAGPPPHEAERREGVDARLHDRGVRDGLSAHSREGRDWRGWGHAGETREVTIPVEVPAIHERVQAIALGPPCANCSAGVGTFEPVSWHE